MNKSQLVPKGRIGTVELHAVSAALADGEKIEAGNLTIENVRGQLILGAGRNFSAVVSVDPYSGVITKYHVRTYGERHTRKIRNPKSEIRNEHPLVKLGQGTSQRTYHGGGNGAA